jgi:hypothetical protein
MDERRDQAAPAQPARPILAAASRLSPLQQAYAKYTDHAVACEACRDVDRTCSEAETLWRAYRAIGENACDRLTSEA